MNSEFDQIKNYLNKVGIDLSDSIDMLAERSDLSLLRNSLMLLCRRKLLSQDTYNQIVVMPNSQYFYLALMVLNMANLVSKFTIQKLVLHPDLFYFERVIFNLNESSLLNIENFNNVYSETQVRHLAKALSVLRHAGILNQANFTALLAAEHRFLLSDFAYLRIWEVIPSPLLVHQWTRLLAAARQEDPVVWMNQILAQITIVINSKQSTHTTSVHMSVAESANRLKKTYANTIELSTKRAELFAFIRGLDHSFQHQVIKRCFLRLCELEHCYLEPISGISTLELMTLFYTAIHDEAKRYGSLDDAKSALLAGLFEIQRGYNIEYGDSHQVPDKPICAAGGFNKLMEKLQGIHPDVRIVFLSKHLLSLKLAIIVKEVSYTYLFMYAQVTSFYHLTAFANLMQQVQEDGVSAIWPKIEPLVSSLLFAEFGNLFDMREDHPEFHAIIESGVYYPLVHLNDFKLAILQFLGEQAWYRDTIKKLTKVDQGFRLWERRHSSVAAQKEFDEHYGLSMIKPGNK